MPRSETRLAVGVMAAMVVASVSGGLAMSWGLGFFGGSGIGVGSGFVFLLLYVLILTRLGK